MTELFLSPFLMLIFPPPATPSRGRADWPCSLLSLQVSLTFPPRQSPFLSSTGITGELHLCPLCSSSMGYRTGTICWGATLDLHCSSSFEIPFFHMPRETLMWFLIVTWEFSRKEKERLTSQTRSCLCMIPCSPVSRSISVKP